MAVEFKKPGATYSKDPTISITKTTIGLNSKAIRELHENFDGDGDPDRVKIGVDQDAGWIVVLPVKDDPQGYKLPQEEEHYSYGSDALRQFILDKIDGLSEEDLNVRYSGFWDESEGAMLFEYV